MNTHKGRRRNSIFLANRDIGGTMPPLNTGPIADALVREFLTRHGLTSTLAAFDQVAPAWRPHTAVLVSDVQTHPK